MYFKWICPNFCSIGLSTPYLSAVQRSTSPQPETKSYALHYLITYAPQLPLNRFLCESQFTLMGLIHFTHRKARWAGRNLSVVKKIFFRDTRSLTNP